ncbi:20533_t:CDS:2, partial [Cetraspora pellucida]
LAKKYCEYIHLSYSSAVKHDIESRCWKIAVYSLIEQFRQENYIITWLFSEFKTLYYYCRSLMVDTSYITACEPLIWSFESNRKQFATLVTSNNKQKQKSLGLEFFDQNLEIFIDKLFRLKDIIFRVIMIQMGQDLDPTFAEESRLTFTVIYQFMSKYLDSISFQCEIDDFEGLLLYYEIVLLWMVANDAFNNFAEKSNNCIRRKFLDKSIYLDFRDSFVRFLTEIAHQVSPFTIKEIIEFPSNIEDSNSIDRNENPSNLYTEDDETSPVTTKSTDFSNNEYISSSTQNFPKKNTSHVTKKMRTSSSSRIAAGYTTIVIDTNCLIGDLNMVKKFIQSDNWMVVVPSVGK